MPLSADTPRRPAVFLDRDGVLNIDHHYVHRPDQFEWVTGAPAAIKYLNQRGYHVFVVTNQSGVARGYYTEDDVEQLHRHINRELARHDAHVDAWFYCPHHPSGKGSYALPCSCRKPLPGMLRAAALRYDIDLEQSYMVGDKQADIEAGMAAGCHTILVRTGYGEKEEQALDGPVEIRDDLLAAVIAILQV